MNEFEELIAKKDPRAVKVGQITVHEYNDCDYFKFRDTYGIYVMDGEFGIYDDDVYGWYCGSALQNVLSRVDNFGLEFTYESIEEIRAKTQNLTLQSNEMLEKILTEPMGIGNIEKNVATDSVITKNTGVEIKMENKNNITNMLGLRNELLEDNMGITLDVEGNLGVNNQHVRPCGGSAELKAENNGFLKLLATTVAMDTLIVGDLVLDPTNGNPVFVKNIDDIDKGEIKLQDFKEGDQPFRTPKKNPITGKATLVKLQNVFAIIGIENLTRLAPLMVGDERRVMNLVVQQIVKNGKLDIDMLEMELNPSLANINLTKTLGDFVTTISQGKNIETERQELEEMRKRLEQKEKELNEREDELTRA